MKVIEMFSGLWKAVFLRHVQSGIVGGGHDAFHAARVGQYAFEIVDDENMAKLACIAGLCHNADHILQHDSKVGRRDVPEYLVTGLLKEWLNYTGLSSGEELIIIDAVLKHSLLNDPNDGLVLMALKDADRLTNLEPDVIMRAAQFYSDLPMIDPIHWLSDPAATLREPKSVLKDLANNSEWGNFSDLKFGIRLPKAQLRAKEFTDFLLDYIERVKKCWVDAGLLPFNPPQ